LLQFLLFFSYFREFLFSGFETVFFLIEMVLLFSQSVQNLLVLLLIVPSENLCSNPTPSPFHDKSSYFSSGTNRHDSSTGDNCIGEKFSHSDRSIRVGY